MSDISIYIRSYDELSIDELYDLLALRTDVFVVEQDCAYPELDYHDQQARHIMLYSGSMLTAYARALPAGTVYDEPSIGRVAVKFNYRGRGMARRVFEMALSELESSYPKAKIKLQAQTYLEKFYADYGFERISDAYPDFGIMHVDMIKQPAKT